MSAPYEEPLNPELIIDTELVSVAEAVDLILKKFMEPEKAVSRRAAKLAE
jgi:adenylylsulfate kinase-like enzyme